MLWLLRHEKPEKESMSAERVLIVEDEPHALLGLAELVRGWGYQTETACNGIEALEVVDRWQPLIVVTDLKMPQMDGMELLRRLGEREQPYAVIVLTAQGSVSSAVEAMKLGAFDYLEKPIDSQRLRTQLASVTKQQAMQLERASAQAQIPSTGGLGPLVGDSEPMRQIYALIERVAPTNVSVLITGESGTGKELVARTLHELSPRRNKPFVAINCAAIPETLIESEIFGHEKGAFTGALERRAGCFELAEEGTLLLDEIGEMPIGTQAKLLRVLEDRRYRRLGSKTETPIDVRVLAATNKDPQQAVESGQLRGDLFYRLNVFNLAMPPLRAHKQDIPAIAERLLADMCAKHDRQITGISPAMLAALLNYDWPGNVRELRNTMERAVILCTHNTLDTEHLPPGFGAHNRSETVSEAPAIALPEKTFQVEVGTTVDEAERRLILRTLESTRNNKTRAAEILGISLKTLHNKLKEYNNP